MTDAAVDKLCAPLGGTLSLEAVIAAEEQVIADVISKSRLLASRHSSSPHLPLVLHGIDD